MADEAALFAKDSTFLHALITYAAYNSCYSTSDTPVAHQNKMDLRLPKVVRTKECSRGEK